MCSWVVEGREVRPRRALEAFCRWEQAWARRTRDMAVEARVGWVLVRGLDGAGCAQEREGVVGGRFLSRDWRFRQLAGEDEDHWIAGFYGSEVWQGGCSSVIMGGFVDP